MEQNRHRNGPARTSRRCLFPVSQGHRGNTNIAAMWLRTPLWNPSADALVEASGQTVGPASRPLQENAHARFTGTHRFLARRHSRVSARDGDVSGPASSLCDHQPTHRTARERRPYLPGYARRLPRRVARVVCVAGKFGSRASFPRVTAAQRRRDSECVRLRLRSAHHMARQ